MARPLRIELAGGFYHVTSRGDGRENIYLCEADRRVWLAIFGEVCKRYNWVCHAWCQMTNHYHIVVETVAGNLSLGMRQLNGIYTQRFNRAHGRVGHVFQGRYRAIVVEKDSYLLELIRYVALNPVRAGMVAQAGDWPWSSYGVMAGVSPKPDWLKTDWVLGQFGSRPDKAVAAYLDFVLSGVGLPSPWKSLRGQIYLGSEEFINRMEALFKDRWAMTEIPKIQRRPLVKPLECYRKTAADTKEAMARAYASGDYTMQEIAGYFGVHYATVSRAVKKHGTAMRDCKT